MSAPTLPPSPSTAMPIGQAVPPYSGPVRASSGHTVMAKVGPFVPVPQRATVPSRIPPYRPLQPAPTASPVLRSPLYIPPSLTPRGGMVVEDEGISDPRVVRTAALAVLGAELDSPSVAAERAPKGKRELPWIDAFLATTPAPPMAAVADRHAAHDGIDQVTEVAASDATEVDAVRVDEWPLEEAAVEFRALRSALDEQSAGEAASRLPGANIAGDAAASVLAPLAEWSDDDLMDFVPLRQSDTSPLSTVPMTADGEIWAERALKAHENAQLFRAMASVRRDADGSTGLADEAESTGAMSAKDATSEEAASSLELLAHRVRAGELALPSYAPRMGEPAALVAALAALLGVRLR